MNDITELAQSLKRRAASANEFGESLYVKADEIRMLVEALERKEEQRANWFQMAQKLGEDLDSAEKRIAELENYAEAEAVGADKAAEDGLYWMKRCKELESRTVKIPDDVLDALQKVARIRLDMNDFDGDRRGIADCLSDAEEALIEVVNRRAAMLNGGKL